MGIRFYCPNGHKVHVKDFQAGQKGLCPICGMGMQIPWQSTRPSSREEEAHPQGGALEAPPRMPASVEGDSPIFADTKIGTVPQPTTFAAPPGGTADALTEAGDLVWYVRPLSGGQFGPAASDIMRAWLAEGRVTADALVWREGWRDWREAYSVFPQLSPAPTFPGLDAIVTESLAAPVSSQPLRYRSQARRTQAMIIGGLVATVLVLFVIFIYVVVRKP